MQQQHTDKIMVVVLEDMVNQSLPRIMSIRHKVKKGGTLSNSEVDFFLTMLNKLSRCYQDFSHDSQCLTILACVAHLLYKVVNRAHENEQRLARVA